MFNKHSIFQNEQQISKAPTRIRWLLTLFTFIIMCFLINPRIVKADANGTHVDTDGNLIVGSGGISVQYDGAGHNKTGWLVYLVSGKAEKEADMKYAYGDVVSEVVYVDRSDSLPEGAVVNFTFPRIGYSDRIIRASKYFVKAEWGTPFLDGGESREPEITAYMEEMVNVQGRSVPRSAMVVLGYLGQEAFDLYTTECDTTYLVLEPCAYHTCLAGVHEGQRLLCSGFGWNLYQTAYGPDSQYSYFTEFGEKQRSSFDAATDTSWVDNRALVKSCMIEEQWYGLPSPPMEWGWEEDNLQRVSNLDTALAYEGSPGFSMLAYKLDQPSINSYDPDEGSPGDPEDPGDLKKGTSAIIKGYYEEDKTTGQKTSLGVYYVNNCTNKINIMDEPDFEMVSWEITNSKTTSMDPLNWNPPGTVSREGTGGTSVELEGTEKAVYILFKREVGEVIEESFILHESQIAAPQTTGTRTSNLNLCYAYGSLEDKCTGHCNHDFTDTCVSGSSYLVCNLGAGAAHDHTADCYGWSPGRCGHSTSCTGVENVCLEYCTYSFASATEDRAADNKTLTFKLNNTEEETPSSKLLIASIDGVLFKYIK